MPTVNDIVAVLAKRVGFDVLSVDPVAGQPVVNQVRLTGRIPPNGQSHWALVMHHVLVRASRMPWKADISRLYFTRLVGNNQEKLFYTWRIIFQGQGLEQHFKSILDTIVQAPQPSRVELAEFPLHGASRKHSNGKGAFTADTNPLVASLAAAARMGGVRQ